MDKATSGGTRHESPFKEKTVLVVGSGPSLRPDDIEVARREGWGILACNDNYVFCPDVLYAPDWQWITHYDPDHPDKWTPELRTSNDFVGWKRVKVLGTAFCSEYGTIANGGNAGHQMINLAAMLGSRRLVLTGYDMQPTGGLVRWRGAHPDGVEKGNCDKYAGWRQKMPDLIPGLAAAGVDVVNATRETALECFRTARLEELLSVAAA